MPTRILLLCASVTLWFDPSISRADYAEIRVLDATTKRGVPLVELETVNGLKFVTDNAGRVAFHEPGLMDREIFFFVRSHGYEVKKDGFGFAGVRVTPRAGKAVEITIIRRNLAERLCRLTGEGLYRDTLLLGHRAPLAASPHPGNVAGQDSVQAAVHRGKVHWFWGDTQRMSYPLGLFRMAGATTPILDAKSFDPVAGIPFDYFVDKTGFARAMMPLSERPDGVIWISAVFTVPDEKGEQRMVAHYSRRKGLKGELEHGIAIFNDEKAIFEPAKQLPLSETWRRPSGHPVVVEEDGARWVVFGSPNPNVRVHATLKNVLDPAQYKAYTCLKDKETLHLDAEGKPIWRWQKERPPVDSKQEHGWIKAGKLRPEHARYCPVEVGGTERILLHSGSVHWNAYRKCWVLLAGQLGGKSSLLGEVWYAEADHPTGPFRKAVRVATHDRYSFYNVCHHAFLDREDGRMIHFEGTYTADFSGNPVRTPRYDYNQVLYRLDLETKELKGTRD